MEHLREHWRQVTASRRTLYRGISLEGASRQYAWGLDQAIVRKFSSAMKKGDHQAAAKLVLDLCEQSGEFVEGGRFGVWWSTDLKVARGYAGMHTRESLGCVVCAEVDDEDINQGHAEQYGFTSESPVVLREGARIDVVAIEVRYNPDLKVLRDGDFVKIPVRRQVTAGVIPANTATHGPFRNVVDVETDDRGFARERLECGHTGKSGWRADWLGTTADGKTVKRRCYDCLTVEHKSWLNDRPGSEGHKCSDACIIPVGQARTASNLPANVQFTLQPHSWIRSLGTTASSVDAWREQQIEVMGRNFVLGDISGGEWFHGSAAVLSVGDRLVPGKTKNFKQSDPNSVSITSDLATAKYWAREVSKITGLTPHIYAVDPVGDVEVWKAGLAEMGTKVNVFEARVRSAVVLDVL